MRLKARLRLLVAVTTSLVLVAFLVPLGLLVRDVAAERATNAALRQAETVAPQLRGGDPAALRDGAARVLADAPGDFPLTVYLSDGTVLGESAPISPAVELARTGRSLTANTRDGREVLVARGGPEGTTVVRAAVSRAQLRTGVAPVWAVLGLLGLLLLGLSLLVADRLARSITAPMDRLVAMTQRLGGGDLSGRVTPQGPPEVRQIAGALNTLSGRIQHLLSAEREYVADLSHQLRTPLTALRLGIEALPASEERERLNAAADAMQQEITRMIREARRPVREGIGAGCDASDVVRSRVAFWSPLAEDEDRDIASPPAPGPLPVAAAAEDLAAALDALIGNVFAHTGEGVGFAVTLTERPGGGARLTVADEGPGLPPDARVLERGAGSEHSTGLGLDIAARTARASGGDLSTATASGGGAVITLDLGPPPMSTASAASSTAPLRPAAPSPPPAAPRT